MILELWLTFVGISLVLIILGFWRSEHSELPLVGFFFLFLLSFVVMGNNLEYETGYSEFYVYGDNYDYYHYDDYNGTTKEDDLNLFHLNHTLQYSSYNDTTGVFNTHLFGYFMAVVSAVGFAGTLFGLRRSKNYD